MLHGTATNVERHDDKVKGHNDKIKQTSDGIKRNKIVIERNGTIIERNKIVVKWNGNERQTKQQQTSDRTKLLINGMELSLDRAMPKFQRNEIVIKWNNDKRQTKWNSHQTKLGRTSDENSTVVNNDISKMSTVTLIMTLVMTSIVTSTKRQLHRPTTQCLTTWRRPTTQ